MPHDQDDGTDAPMAGASKDGRAEQRRHSASQAFCADFRLWVAPREQSGFAEQLSRAHGEVFE